MAPHIQRIRAKICGITRVQDVRAVADAGADAIGFVFFPPSPRYVTITQAATLVQAIPAYIQVVGLFVNADAAEIEQVLQQVPLDVIQFHGDETPEQCQMIAQQVKRRWYKAIQVKPDLDVVTLIQQYQQAGASAVLLDAWHPDLKGGTGHAFDWTKFPKLDLPLILAGGLNPDNIQQAIDVTQPYAVDVSGGVESAKGIKTSNLFKDLCKESNVDQQSANDNNPMIDYTQFPDAKGHFGIHGGRFVSETLMAALQDLESLYFRMKDNAQFQAEFDHDLAHYVGRPSPLYHAERWSKELGGAQIYLKREDLNHTGSHKVNNTIGQALLAKLSGKKRIIAETGAGQHGVATATIAARLGLECVVYMGADDVKRQAMNVYRMRLLGATVVPVESGSKTLKDAMNEAMRDWVTNVDTTYYVIGTVAGPHPYPQLVRDFQAIIGREARQQILAQAGRLPDALVACVGGGSNAMGLFYPFLNDQDISIYGVEAAGHGIESGKHSAPLNAGHVGVLHGNRTYLMSDAQGQIIETHSISAGLDYPGVGPEHSFLKDMHRVNYVPINDTEALQGFRDLTKIEGIIPALESAHAMAYVTKLAPTMAKDQIIIATVSGRGDKDLMTVAKIDDIPMVDL